MIWLHPHTWLKFFNRDCFVSIDETGCIAAKIISNCTGMSVAVMELIDLQRIWEGLLFDTEVVAGPDIYNNFGLGPVGKVT